MRTLNQLYVITHNTLVESIRQPIFMVLILIGSLAMVFNPMLAAYTMDDDNKLLIDMGLSTLLLVGLMLAAFTATGVLNREIENHTVLTVVSKPVARPLFILGKFIGVATALFIAYWSLTAVFLLTIRQQVMQTARDHIDGPVATFGLGAVFLAVILAAAANYYYRKPFVSTLVMLWGVGLTLAWAMTLVIGKDWKIQPIATDIDTQRLIGIVMVFWAVLMLTALAIAVSTRVKQVMTLVICVGFFLIGTVSDYVFGRAVVHEQYAFTKWLYMVIPNFQFMWPADALTQGHDITPAFFGLVSGYAAAYIAALLALGVVLFQTREVG